MPTASLISREANVARVRVELPAAEVDAAFKAVYRQLGRELKVPGFRPGKVPPNIIRQRVGADAVRGEVDDRLRQLAVDFALQELKLEPRSGRPRFEGEAQAAEGEALSYEFSLAVLPEVTLPDYASWTIEVPRVELSDELKQRFEQRLIDRFTTTAERDGPAESGDLLTIGVHTTFADSGEPSPFGGHDIGFVIGREGNLPGWDEQLLGASAGAEKDFDYAMPEDFADARVAGKALKVHMHIDKVESLAIPVLDEPFIKEKLGMESRQQFDEYITASLEREIEMQLLQTEKEAAMERLARELSAEISEDMLKDEVDGMVAENDRMLRRNNTSLDAYLADKGQSLAEYREGLRDAALGRVRFFLAAKTIADKQDLTAGREDFRRYAMFLMQREGLSPEQVGELMQQREFYNEAAYQIVLEKVLNHLAETVKFEVK